MYRVASLVLALSACSRTPAEPEPVATNAVPAPSASSLSPASTSATARCLTAMAVNAPDIPKAARTCPADPEPGKPLAIAKVVFPDTNGLSIQAELALTPHDIEKGLMFRRHMNEDAGMLFHLEERRDHTFWMQNTCISLDMLFIEEDGTIVGVVEGAEPVTQTSRSVGCSSRYVLEMNGGWCRSHGVKPGQRVTLPAAAR